MKNPDRLYELLPAVYRTRDAENGYALRALLRVATASVPGSFQRAMSSASLRLKPRESSTRRRCTS